MAFALGNLAELLGSLGDYKESALLWERVVATGEASLGTEHPQVARDRSTLATVRIRQGRFDEARVLLELALEHTDERHLAEVLNNTGGLHQQRGDFEGARELFGRAIALQLARYGSGHPEVLSTQRNLAAALRSLGRHDEALTLLEQVLSQAEVLYGPADPALLKYLTALVTLHQARSDDAAQRAVSARALAITTATLLDVLPELGEREALSFSAVNRPVLDSFIAAYDAPEEIEQVYEAVFHWKGGVAAALTSRRQSMFALGLPQSARVASELLAVRRKLAQQTLAPFDPAQAEFRGAELARLGERRGHLERKLAAMSRQYRMGQQAEDASLPDLCAAMVPGATLVDYLRVNVPEPSYIAFVIRQEDCAITVFNLGSAVAIDTAVRGHREVLASGLTGLSDERVDDRGRRLAALIWDPLEVADEQVTIVPDGAIAGVSFAALPVGERYLVEDFEIAYRESAGELMQASSSTQNDGALFVGALDYGEPSGVDMPCVQAEFGALPGTANELSSVMALWDKKSGDRHRFITGDLATEEAVLAAMRGQRVVHFATHGLFATARCPSALTAGGIGYDPMALSGIVLSGANEKLGSLGGEDGILTAAELAGVRLRGTQLVVLSGCETGMGEAVSGEGVLGLRRAIAASGARALVMSLWAVPDASTALMMEDFYRFFLKKRSVATALRKAQLARLQANRKAVGHGHPGDWAGFIAAGRTRE